MLHILHHIKRIRGTPGSKFKHVCDLCKSYFGVVSEPEDDQPRGVLVKALELNLFGSETLGMHLGLFGNALVLSGTLPMEGLTAEDFAERLLFLSRHIGKLAEKLEIESDSGNMQPPGDSLSPWGAGFMQV